MKIRLLFFLFLAFSLSAQGQKPFSSRVLNYTWVYKSFIWAQVSNRYSSKLDTPVANFNGKDYYSFENFKIADSGSKVFALTGTKEYLLMDYSLNVGDTLVSQFTLNPFKLKVITKSKVKIEHDSLWRMELKSVAHPTNVPALIWIESLGCLNAFHPINWPSKFNVSDLGFNLDCVIHTDTSILKALGKNCGLDHNIIHPSKKWYVWTSVNNGDIKVSSYYQFLSNDTFIAGKKCNKMNVPNTYVRYDTSTGKYFVISNLYGEEIMVYNERAKVGDTMFHVRNTVDTVQRIEYSWVQDVIRKKTTTNGDIYYSGIGSEARVLWDNHLITFTEYQAGNICYGESEIIKYHFPFYFENKQSCDITSSIQNGWMSVLSVYPNPVSNVIYLSDKELYDYEIYDLAGQRMQSGRGQALIELKSLSVGHYILQLMRKDEIRQFRINKN